MNSKSPFKWRHFLSEIILWGVRWYCLYPISYRQLEEMMCERGVEVNHSTLSRWVQKYTPELDKRCRPHLKPTGKEELSEQVELRQNKYLNNLVEQNHRFIKRLTRLGMEFYSFNTARRTLRGYEAMNMLRKG